MILKHLNHRKISIKSSNINILSAGFACNGLCARHSIDFFKTDCKLLNDTTIAK